MLLLYMDSNEGNSESPLLGRKYNKLSGKYAATGNGDKHNGGDKSCGGKASKHSTGTVTAACK